MIDAIAGGLIAGSAVLFVSTLVRTPDVGTSRAEYARGTRVSQTATAVSGSASLIGALLLIVGSQWFWALVGVGAVAATTYVTQAARTYRAWFSLRADVDREVASSGGRITVWTAGDVGTMDAPAATAPGASHLIPTDHTLTALTRALVEERARIGWALRHPFGQPRR